MLDTCAKNRKIVFLHHFLVWVLWRLVQVKKFDRSGSIRHFTLAKLPSSSFLVLLCTHTMTLAHMASNKKGSPFTMLQKLSICKVKAWLCQNLIILLPIRFYVKSNFGEFKSSKNVIFGNFRDSELWILENLGLESCWNLLNSNFWTSKIVKIIILGSFEFTKIWFHVKSEWQ